ncbi:MAG: aromatic amino acid lyase [Candidatus Electrothrix sp. AW2]|nr:aromatic amino acid lyase [Candidatus Electrothrix gigas]
MIDKKIITVRGEGLTIEEVASVASGSMIHLTDDEKVWQKIQASHDTVIQAVKENQPIYGVTTNFGGMANLTVSKEKAIELQHNLLRSFKSGCGERLPVADVRAGILLRLNSLMRGVSGVRHEIIRRLETFLNEGVTPHVYELGSIGASGDLIPLSYIAGSLIGLDAGYKVDLKGEEKDCLTVLSKLGLPRLELAPKEALALMNGTSVLGGIAANNIYQAEKLLGLTVSTHAMMLQGLYGTNQSFHPFIHQHKFHPGQLWVAEKMLALLKGSGLIRNELNGNSKDRGEELLQDRYSLRCLPQFMGPIVDGLAQIAEQIETEANSATDNPLIDADVQAFYNGGNFLGQYIGVGMDQLRYYFSLMAKHLDTQIALLVSPEFNNGLSPSLVGNTEGGVNLGLKALQLLGNSIMPILSFLGNSLADRFPTHAEQFNQNINSQGFGSANLTRQSISMYRQYMALSLMFSIQSVDLRNKIIEGHYDARVNLSQITLNLYEAVRAIVGQPPSSEYPYIWNDNEQQLDKHIKCIVDDLEGKGTIFKAISPILRCCG